MKKLLWTLAVMLFMTNVYAQHEKEPVNKTGISKSEMQSRVQENVNRSIDKETTDESREAIEVLKQTQEVIASIAQKKNKEAEEKLAQIIGKLEVLLAKKPDLALIPVGSTIEVKDVITDINTVEEIMTQVRKAIDKGYFQEAKRVLNDLSSEMVIKTSYLPMATYPDAMKLSAKLLSENKNTEAASVLAKALTTLIVKEDIIPLPVLRAEEYIKGALALMDNEKKFEENKETLLALLDAADYQLKLAEAMGYGKKDREYKELADAIVLLKKNIEKGKERKSKKGLKALDEKLTRFKERLFPVKKQS